MSKVLIVTSQFYADISAMLVQNAVIELSKAGIGHEIVEVRGTLEIPVAITFAVMGNRNKYDGYLALGCVIRGETDHYKYVCSNSLRTLSDIAVQHAVSMGIGVITADNMQMAMYRASSDGKNIAAHAAKALINLMNLYDKFLR